MSMDLKFKGWHLIPVTFHQVTFIYQQKTQVNINLAPSDT